MIERIALGTVQFGLDYGVTNTTGQTSADDVDRILELAASSGIQTLDTAALYGDAEAAIGASDFSAPFDVVTKTPHFTTADDLTKTFERSLHRLGRRQVYGLLVHRPQDLLGEHADLVWSTLADFKDQGLVAKLGVSVYDAEELAAIRSRYPVELVQLPCGVFDPVLSATIATLEAEGVEVHVRSLFLQGLVFMADEAPRYFDPVRPILRRWREAVQHVGATPLQAALAFGATLPATKLVLGVENAQQLQEVIDAAGREVTLDWPSFDLGDDRFRSPKNWVLDD